MISKQDISEIYKQVYHQLFHNYKVCWKYRVQIKKEKCTRLIMVLASSLHPFLDFSLVLVITPRISGSPTILTVSTKKPFEKINV